MSKSTKKRMGVLVVAGAMTLLFAVASFADTWEQGKGWRLDANKHVNTYIYKN